MGGDNIAEREIQLAVQTTNSGTTAHDEVCTTPVVGQLVEQVVALGMRLKVLEQGMAWHSQMVADDGEHTPHTLTYSSSNQVVKAVQCQPLTWDLLHDHLVHPSNCLPMRGEYGALPQLLHAHAYSGAAGTL